VYALARRRAGIALAQPLGDKHQRVGGSSRTGQDDGSLGRAYQKCRASRGLCGRQSDLPEPGSQRLARGAECSRRTVKDARVVASGDDPDGRAADVKQARGMATPEVVERARFEATDPGLSGYWKASFPGELPQAPVLPASLYQEQFEGGKVQWQCTGGDIMADGTIRHEQTQPA
jgi:hypothetical protein